MQYAFRSICMFTLGRKSHDLLCNLIQENTVHIKGFAQQFLIFGFEKIHREMFKEYLLLKFRPFNPCPEE